MLQCPPVLTDNKGESAEGGFDRDFAAGGDVPGGRKMVDGWQAEGLGNSAMHGKVYREFVDPGYEG